eukprot:2760344-Amphidinium_carterae.1
MYLWAITASYFCPVSARHGTAARDRGLGRRPYAGLSAVFGLLAHKTTTLHVKEGTISLSRSRMSVKKSCYMNA